MFRRDLLHSFLVKLSGKKGNLCIRCQVGGSPERSEKRTSYFTNLLSLVYIVIFLKRYAPTTVITRAKPPIAAKQTPGLIWDTPVRPYRIPSTP